MANLIKIPIQINGIEMMLGVLDEIAPAQESDEMWAEGFNACKETIIGCLRKMQGEEDGSRRESG